MHIGFLLIVVSVIVHKKKTFGKWRYIRSIKLMEETNITVQICTFPKRNSSLLWWKTWQRWTNGDKRQPEIRLRSQANPCGSGFLKIKLLLVCLRNYDDVWSYHGWLVEDEKLLQDYRAERVYHFVEGLLENMPQMILQIYVTIIQEEKISDLQIISISVTFVNLVWVLTLFEYSSLVNRGTLTHFIAMTVYNACLIAARGLSIVTFLVALKWVTSAVLAFHEFVCISIYFYRNHEYFSEKKVWWIACLLMPCYIFVYLGFKVKDLNSKVFDIKLGRSIVSSSLFYLCFTSENVLMVSLFFSWAKTSDSTWNQKISKIITVCVIVLSLLGTVIQLGFTFVFFRKSTRVRPNYQQETQGKSSLRQSHGSIRITNKYRLL